jgi:hypothetical protein
MGFGTPTTIREVELTESVDAAGVVRYVIVAHIQRGQLLQLLELLGQRGQAVAVRVQLLQAVRVCM